MPATPSLSAEPVGPINLDNPAITPTSFFEFVLCSRVHQVYSFPLQSKSSDLYGRVSIWTYNCVMQCKGKDNVSMLQWKRRRGYEFCC